MRYTYEFTTAQGRSCCKTNDPKLLCPACKAKVAGHRAASSVEDFTPPEPYAAGIAKLRQEQGR